ncbi:lysoplasmalogenase family protein [Flavonifractor hominis]|uniref:Lysoplasmalogenase family protein n=1 Tax=Flavonifractor hominis TaxID=3133178 RepID=A0ABV1EK60_9FIRM
MKKRKWIPAFLCAEGCLYLCFLLLDLLDPGSWMSTALKYGGILLCFALSLVRTHNRDSGLMCAALACTALADLFLLVLNTHYLAGVACFCVVQLLYRARLRRRLGGRAWPDVAVRALLTGAALLAVWQLGALNALSLLALFYFVQLAVNAAESLRLGRKGLYFSVGLILFLCCDICVGLHNLAAFLPPDGLSGAIAFAQIGMWLFYLPSQVLLTLSIEMR